MSSDQIFEDIVKVYVKDPKISHTKMFGSPGLKISGKVFAFLLKGKLVLKLPKERVDSLIATKKGNNFGHLFAPGKWKSMKEWVALTPTSTQNWLKLTHEAKDFVKSLIK